MTTRFPTMILIAMAGVVPALGDVFSVQPSSVTATAGQLFSIDLQISGATDLAGYNLDLGFDPSIVAADSVTEGPFLPGAGATSFFPGTIDNTSGTISFVADLLLSGGAAGTGTLATVQFTALAPGTTALTIFNVIALNSFGEDIAVTTDAGAATVEAAAVPEPASAALLLTVALALVSVRRRKLG